MDDELAGVPSFSTGATFFDANAQAHHVPLSAFGDLTDNASEAGASRLLIAIEDSSSSSSNLAISMTDDGCGMSEHKLRTGIGGIGHSDKGGRSEDHCALVESRTLHTSTRGETAQPGPYGPLPCHSRARAPSTDGMGAKTAMARLSANTLVFSKVACIAGPNLTLTEADPRHDPDPKPDLTPDTSHFPLPGLG